MPRNLNAERDNPCLKVSMLLKKYVQTYNIIVLFTGTRTVIQMPK